MVRAEAEARLGMRKGGLQHRKREIDDKVGQVLAEMSADANPTNTTTAAVVTPGGTGGRQGEGDGALRCDQRQRNSAPLTFTLNLTFALAPNAGADSSRRKERVELHVEGLDSKVYTVALKEKHLASLEALSIALSRVLPEGAVPTASQLAAMKMKYTTTSADDHGNKVRLDPAEAGAMQQAAREAKVIYIWPRKTS